MILLRSGTHHSKVFIEPQNNKKLNTVRKESDKNFIDMKKEIKFLISLNKKQLEHFPDILDYSLKEDTIFYTMPFYTMPTLRDSIFNSSIKIDLHINLINKILNFLVNQIYSVNLINLPDENFLRMAHINRVKNRLLSLLSVDHRLKEIIQCDDLEINGKLYVNVLPIIEELLTNDDLHKKLIPPKTHMIHGDFHFDNILVNDQKVNSNSFILIDPRGESSGYDYSYDLGKLWHSSHGKYDLLHEGLFSIDYDLNKSNNNIYMKFKTDNKFKRLNIINDALPELISSFDFFNVDNNWFLKTCFSEAMHFCSLAPFHINNNIDFAIGRYAIGVILINNFINHYNDITPSKWNDQYYSVIS